MSVQLSVLNGVCATQFGAQEALKSTAGNEKQMDTITRVVEKKFWWFDMSQSTIAVPRIDLPTPTRASALHWWAWAAPRGSPICAVQGCFASQHLLYVIVNHAVHNITWTNAFYFLIIFVPL